MLFLFSQRMAEISLCTKRKVLVHVRPHVVDTPVRHIAESIITRNRILSIFCIAQLSSIVGFFAKPSGVVGVGALIRSGEREIEQCFETIGQIERSHNAVRTIEFLRILQLIENVIGIFILLILAVSHVVGVSLVEEIRTIVVEGR